VKPERIPPGTGQESVWDYPRPPRLEEVTKHIQVIFNGEIIADTHRAKRVLETSHPPAYYIPFEDIKPGTLLKTQRETWCEWKGGGSYYTVKVGDKQAENAAWSYLNPVPSFLAIKNCVSFYPGLMDACYVEGEKVKPQPGNFYGGWITSEIVGPFKGEPGTQGW
jgi:uncharacterized protein (DUF427 family)